MSAFSTRPGRFIFVDVSFDAFATVSYRYATAPYIDGAGNEYDPRLLDVGSIQRVLGNDYGMTPQTVPITIGNADFGADWLVNRATVESSLFKSQWRVSIGYYTPGAYATTLLTKQLGIFVTMNNPVRTTGDIKLTLGDRTFADACEFAATPTLADIIGDLYADGIVASSDINALHDALQVDPYTPIRLAFGSEPIPIPRISTSSRQYGTSGERYVGYLVCATTDTAVATANEVALVYTVMSPIERVVNGYTIWEARRSSTVTKDGKSWKVIYIRFDTWAMMHVVDEGGITGAQFRYPNFDMPMSCSGSPLSSRTIAAVASSAIWWKGSPNLAEVAYDLLRYYSRGLGASDVDAASFARVAQNSPGSTASGVIDGISMQRVTPVGLEVVGGALRSTVSDIARSGFFDVFSGWDGKFRAADQTNGYEEQTATLVELDEHIARDVRESIPSVGDRWAPFNRIYVQATDIDPETNQRSIVTAGPFDWQAQITSWGRIMPRTFVAKWLSEMSWGLTFSPHFAQFWPTFWSAYAGRVALQPVVRPTLSFFYASDALEQELGDYVTFTWSRGGGGSPVYTSSIFRIEGLSYTFGQDLCEVTMVWMGDLRADNPYLLDDETLITRATGSGGRTVTLTTGSTTVAFSSGSLITDGIAAGDMLVLTDTTEAGDTFKRSRALRVASVTDATHLVYSDASTDFGAAGPYTTGSWKLMRGWVTYPTSVGDPTNYPSGSAMYGKMSDAAGKFSDSTTQANKFLSG